MAGKPVTALPGIGRAWGRLLNQNGFIYASQILGQYLVFNQDPQLFIGWLQSQFGIYRGWCVYTALRDWCLHYL